MAVAAPNAKLRWVLAEQQQLLQQQVQRQMQQLLDQHNAAIIAMLEEDFCPMLQNPDSAKAPQQNVLSHADADPTEATPQKTTATAATTQTTLAATAATSSGSEALVPVDTKRKHPPNRISVLIEERADTPPSSAKAAVSRFMRGQVAAGIISAAILGNTLVMYIQLQWLGSIADASLGLGENIGSWGSAAEVFKAFDFGFGILFLLELLLNVYAFRWEYFTSMFNIVDSAVVLAMLLETFVLQVLSHHVGNMSFLRVLRLVKFTRALRVVRTMTMFSKLRILLSTIAFSVGSFVWSMLLMFFLMLMGTIFLCQMLHDFVIDEGADHATRTWVNARYGSGNKALYTFLEITFSGGWPNNVSKVVKEVNPFYVVFFAIYVTCVVFGMVRIISALFLSETIQQANRDTEFMVLHNLDKANRLKREVSDLFDAADTSGDGLVTFEELDTLLSHHKVRAWLTELGINPNDTQMLFELLDGGDGTVDKDEFVMGLAKLKGEARTQDLLPVATNCHRILAHCKEMQHAVETIAASMDAVPPQSLIEPHYLSF